MPAHSPIPWSYVPEKQMLQHVAGRGPNVLDAEDKTIARVVGGNAFAEANARLMTAAPKMLAALKRLLARSEKIDDTSDNCVHAEDAARAAIAAAEGQASHV